MSEKIFLTRASMPPIEEFIDEIKDMWDNHWITSMGPKHDLFEKELQTYFNIENVSIFTNGHNALELVIQALELSGEVITSPFTFISTTHAIVRNGLTPVFCDINPHDFTIDVDKIESLITEKTSAIIPVHVYGNICDVEKINDIAKKHNLKVIYDAAHTFGEKYRGKSVATFGDASIYSFHASKVFNSIEGGCVSTNNGELQDKLSKLRNFGFSNGIAEFIGTNAKMNEFVAAMGLCNLKHVNDAILKRKRLSERYDCLLAGVSGIKFNIKQHDLDRNYSYYPIIIDPTICKVSRDELYKALNKKNIQALRNFYPIISEHLCYKNMRKWEETPVAEYISNQILLLPLYEDLTLHDVDNICSAVKTILA